MTNRIALILGLLIFIFIVLDLALRGPGDFVFLGKRLFELIEWIAFWR